MKFLVTQKPLSQLSPPFKGIVFLFFIFLFASCRTIATYEETTFVQTSELKAKTLVLMDHATEDYAKYSDQVDNVLVAAEKLYSMQKAREKNTITIQQWKVLMEQKDPVNKQTMLPGFFRLWKNKKVLSQYFIEQAHEQMAEAFDELLKLESRKLKS